MAKTTNHAGKYGYNATGKDKFRNMAHPDSDLTTIDFADFQFSPNSLGMTDGDALFNCGGNGFQINIIVEFKRAAHTARYTDDRKEDAIPLGQRIAIENMAKGIHDSAVKTTLRKELAQGNKDIDFNTIESTRQPGTASVIILASHPDEKYPSGAEAIVEKVFWANDAYSKTSSGWQMPTGKGIKPTLAQYVDLISQLLDSECPEANPVIKFRAFAKQALLESGQVSLTNNA